MKIIAVILCLFIFPNSVSALGKTESGSQSAAGAYAGNSPSRLTMKEQYDTGHWIIKPSNNTLTIIGVSSPMIRRKDEINAAQEDAARKAAMYLGIQGRIETANSAGAGFVDYQHDSTVEIIYDTGFEKYKTQLAFDPENDVLVTREGVFIRFHYPAEIAYINYNSTIVNGRPSWLKNSEKPEFEGYITAVGFSRNQRWLKDTIQKSTEDAVARMIESLSNTVNTKEESATGQGSSSFVHIVSEGKLYGFQVIEFWIEPETRYVYTLAVARAGG